MNKQNMAFDRDKLTDEEWVTVKHLVKKAEPWMEINKTVYVCDVLNGTIESKIWNDTDGQRRLLAMGLVYPTREQAEWKLEHLKVCAELERLADGADIAYDFYYSREMDAIEIFKNDMYSNLPYVFASYESARQAIDTIGEQRLKKYYFGVED